MIYFESYEILTAALFFLLFGCACGMVYPSAKEILTSLTAFLFPLRRAYLKYTKHKIDIEKTKQKKNKLNIENHIVDFLFVIVVGIVYITMIYILLDGAVRVYSFFFFSLGFLITKRYIGKHAGYVIAWMILRFISLYDFLVYLLFVPFMVTAFFAIKLLKPKLCSISNKVHKIIFMRKVKRKIKEIYKI